LAFCPSGLLSVGLLSDWPFVRWPFVAGLLSVGLLSDWPFVWTPVLKAISD